MKFWWGQYKKTKNQIWCLIFFKVECLWKMWINIFNSIMEKYFCWYYNSYNLSISSWKIFSSTQFKFVWYLINSLVLILIWWSTIFFCFCFETNGPITAQFKPWLVPGISNVYFWSLLSGGKRRKKGFAHWSIKRRTLYIPGC